MCYTSLASPYFIYSLFFSSSTRPMSRPMMSRPMSSSSDEDNNDGGYCVVKASSFRQKCFWAWAKGADFLTIPFTGTIRCLIENEENHERVDPCRGCVEVWRRSGLRDSLQSVHWGRAELLSEVCFGIVRMFWSTCC